MVEIQLTQGHVALIDDEDFELVSRYSWRLLKTGKLKYAITNTVGRNSTIRLHRLIMGEPAGMQIDHIDGDGLNCTRENLRSCTLGQNGLNRVTLNSRNTSGVAGVSWYKRAEIWEAHIQIGTKKKHLGRFATLEAAANARRDAELKYYGEFAPLRQANGG